MIQILHDTHINFMKYRRYFYLFSLAVMLATVAWLVVHGGPRWSVDSLLDFCFNGVAGASAPARYGAAPKRGRKPAPRP